MENVIVTLDTCRTHHSAQAAAKNSMTAGELISYLEQYSEDTKVVFCNDEGYTYGVIEHNSIGEVSISEED